MLREKIFISLFRLANHRLELTAALREIVRPRSSAWALARPFKEEMMLPEKQKKAYRAFYDSARHNEYFDEKTTILLHLASAFAIGCYPWMEHYLGVAKEKGITDNEIGAAQSIVMAVSAGRITAQFKEVRQKKK